MEYFLLYDADNGLVYGICENLSYSFGIPSYLVYGNKNNSNLGYNELTVHSFIPQLMESDNE